MMTCPVCAGVRLRAARVPAARELVRCEDCALVFVPVPTPPPPARARLSDAERRLEARVAERRMPHFARLLRTVRPPGRLLDVGSGVGALLEAASADGWQAVGVDVDPAVVAHARARGLDARLGELAALALPAASFDLVTLWNVLDFAPDPVALLAECRRLLAPGGRLFVRTPNAPVQRAGVRLARALAAAGLDRRPEGRPRWFGVLHAFNFSARTLRTALDRAGFVAVDVRNSAPIGGDPYLGLDRGAERLLGAGKRVVFGLAQAAAAASGGRWLLGPSLEARGRRAR
jgi:SAM-dependent methyltransferase